MFRWEDMRREENDEDDDENDNNRGTNKTECHLCVLPPHLTLNFTCCLHKCLTLKRELKLFMQAMKIHVYLMSTDFTQWTDSRTSFSKY